MAPPTAARAVAVRSSRLRRVPRNVRYVGGVFLVAAVSAGALIGINLHRASLEATVTSRTGSQLAGMVTNSTDTYCGHAVLHTILTARDQSGATSTSGDYGLGVLVRNLPAHMSVPWSGLLQGVVGMPDDFPLLGPETVGIQVTRVTCSDEDPAALEQWLRLKAPDVSSAPAR
jgi:hypothetical protein